MRIGWIALFVVASVRLAGSDVTTTSEIGRFANGSWRMSDRLPPAIHGHGEALRGAWVAPDGTAFLAGYNYTGVAGPDTGVVYRQSPGGAWTISFRKPDHEVGHLFGTSASDVWVAGVNTVAHWDGKAWRDMPPPGDHYMSGVWGRGGDVYVAASERGARSGSEIYRRDARGTWTVETTTDNALFAIGGVGDELYAVGNHGVILHRSDGKWTQSSTGDDQHTSVAAIGPGDAYIAGTRLLHLVAGEWKPVTLPNSAQVISVWARSATDVYAGTLDGLFHWDGHAWKPTGWTHDVEAIAGNAREILVANQHMVSGQVIRSKQ